MRSIRARAKALGRGTVCIVMLSFRKVAGKALKKHTHTETYINEELCVQLHKIFKVRAELAPTHTHKEPTTAVCSSFCAAVCAEVQPQPSKMKLKQRPARRLYFHIFLLSFCYFFLCCNFNWLPSDVDSVGKRVFG